MKAAKTKGERSSPGGQRKEGPPHRHPRQNYQRKGSMWGPQSSADIYSQSNINQGVGSSSQGGWHGSRAAGDVQ